MRKSGEPLKTLMVIGVFFFFDKINGVCSIGEDCYTDKKEMTMALARPEVRSEYEIAFNRAKAELPQEVVERVMRGLPVQGDSTPPIRALRQAWSRYHECL